MEEIYWLQRIGSLQTLCVIATAVVGIGGFIFACFFSDLMEWEEKDWKKFFNITIPIFIISLLGSIFIPTKNEMYAIYGIGGTIDYLKENPTAQKIPETLLESIEKWIEGMNEEEKN